jgi:hypothetical protein
MALCVCVYGAVCVCVWRCGMTAVVGLQAYLNVLSFTRRRFSSRSTGKRLIN